ncbi:hypothetical protein KIN20_038216 [Parelaphostrongylus tenuis]|uniref:Uncharacterized protein n=1 Tax=Parelaphostrongylus tenuis TaxID=148309 RepID=A0AAD5REI7_PARTN|nr:hypothetical protein KIN20_038216 [Parelaphostrongylus tenuis]
MRQTTFENISRSKAQAFVFRRTAFRFFAEFDNTNLMNQLRRGCLREVDRDVVIEAAKEESHPAVIKYIITKECIRTYVSNIKSSNIHPKETAEMIICLLCILKDSSRQTSQLIDEFSHSNGYLAIKDFILRNENDHDVVRNILLMLISVVTNGPNEIKPQHSSGLVQLPTFHLPNPSGSGLSVRNTQAFGLIHKVFLESHNSTVCATAIDVVHSIYTCDPANYFILDKEYPLALFIEQMDRKDNVVRAKYLNLWSTAYSI